MKRKTEQKDKKKKIRKKTEKNRKETKGKGELIGSVKENRKTEHFTE